MARSKHRKPLKLLCSLTIIAIIFAFTPNISFADDGNFDRITGFVPLEVSDYYYEGNPDESELLAGMPDTLTVYLNGSSEATELPVSWEFVEDFGETDYYLYSVKPVWSDSYELDSSLDECWDVPWITIYKQDVESGDDPEEMNEELSEILDDSDADVIYTEEEGAIDPSDSSIGDDIAAITDAVKGRIFESCFAATSNSTKIYNYLTNTMGLNMAAACGVMANIYAESGMIPNNLQNTYNHSFGLSDAEYTSRVDKGKGKYKTASGTTKYFKSDSGGYGLCQWTSSGRKANLLSKALDKGVSVANLNNQMRHLTDELQNSYSSVWHTLKNVPNNAHGAYLAAAHFCIAFEAPYDYINVSQSRGKTAVTSYWNSYSGNNAKATGTSYQGLCSYAYPAKLLKGKGMTVKGYAISNYKISSVTAAILKSDDSVIKKKTVSPSAPGYNLGKLDSAMTFSKLDAGSYKFKISVTDKNGKTLTKVHSFKVISSGSSSIKTGFATTSTKDTGGSTPAAAPATGASTLSATGCTKPGTLYEGNGFTIKGTVKSNYEITSVKIKIVNADGKAVITKSDSPSARSFSLSNLDNAVKFGTLKKGSYKYKVIAKDLKKSKTLVNKDFTVKAASTIRTVDANYPTKMKKGKFFTIKGSVKSNYYLRTVTAKIVTTSGSVKYSGKVTLTGKKKKTYDLYGFDDDLKFSKLAKGTYYYKISGSDAGASKELLKKKFTVY